MLSFQMEKCHPAGGYPFIYYQDPRQLNFLSRKLLLGTIFVFDLENLKRFKVINYAHADFVGRDLFEFYFFQIWKLFYKRR